MSWMGRRRRYRCGVFLSVGLLVVVVGAGIAPASASEIHEDGVVHYDETAEVFVIEYTYSVPSAVDSLTIEFGVLEAPIVRVTDTQNLERVDETTFEWDGRGTPRIELEHEVGGETFTDGYYGYVTEDAAFTGMPTSSIAYYSRDAPHDRTSSYSFDGTGHVGNGFVYAGEYEKRSRTVDGRTIEVVVVDEVSQPIDSEGVLDIYAAGERYLDSRFDRERVTLFVLPSERRGNRPGGQVASGSIWIDEAKMGIDTIDNTPAHEYGHVLFGVFGTDDMYWLKEASAQYYGFLLSLNADIGTFEEFHETASTDRYSDAVLADANEMRRSSADYHKGAHVLAALDAAIRERSNGRNTLLDVILTDEHDVSTYDGFRAAVVDASTDSSMAGWVDTYVRTEATPEIPAQRRYYTLGDRPPESIPTATPTPTPAPTETRQATEPSQPTRTRASGDGEYIPVEHVTFEPLPWAEIWVAVEPPVDTADPVSKADLRPAVVAVVDEIESESYAGTLIERAADFGFLVRTEDDLLRINAERIDRWYAAAATPTRTSPQATQTQSTPTRATRAHATPTLDLRGKVTPGAIATRRAHSERSGPGFGVVSGVVAVLLGTAAVRRRME